MEAMFGSAVEHVDRYRGEGSDEYLHRGDNEQTDGNCTRFRL